MTHCSNQLRSTHGPRTAAPSRAMASPALALRVRTLRELPVLGALAVASLITVLVLITGHLSAEYGFV